MRLNLRERLLKTKEVSIWGLGYLGYTLLLRLQGLGFRAKVFDLSSMNNKKFLSDNYPQAKQVISWSKLRSVPELKKDQVDFHWDPSGLFDNVDLHFICIPSNYTSGEYNSNYKSLAEIFRQHMPPDKEVFVVFQSVSGPGSLSRDFIRLLEVNQQKHIKVCAAFRTDWEVEEYYSDKLTQLLAADDLDTCKEVSEVYKLLGLNSELLLGLESSELIHNAASAIENLVGASLNQLSIAYPKLNIRQISTLILKSVKLENCEPGWGKAGVRIPYALENLLRESSHENALSLMQESMEVHHSLCLTYADFLIRQQINVVAIWGIGTRRKIFHSPTLLLARSLLSRGVKVKLHDPSFDRKSIEEMIPGVEYFNFDKLEFDGIEALVIGADHAEYVCLSESDFKANLNEELRYILDGVTIYKNINLPEKLTYHCPGDGSLDVLDSCVE